jgi:hypothetical protein
VAQVVWYLPNKSEVLISTPTTGKRKKKSYTANIMKPTKNCEKIRGGRWQGYERIAGEFDYGIYDVWKYNIETPS